MALRTYVEEMGPCVSTTIFSYLTISAGYLRIVFQRSQDTATSLLERSKMGAVFYCGHGVSDFIFVSPLQPL